MANDQVAAEAERRKKAYVGALDSLASNVVNVAIGLPGVPLDSIAYVIRSLLQFGAAQISPLETNENVPAETMRIHRAIVAAGKAFHDAMEAPSIVVAGSGTLHSLNGHNKRR